MRRHGLQAPLDPHQLASWLVFFALASGVYAFYMPFVEDQGVRWFLVALYSVLVVAIVTLDLYTSYLDPSDPGLTGATDGEFFCGLCQASVARSSKHCRACDRCVEGFDHHCKWLNNCVGARNYWHFFGLITSTVSLLVLQLAWGLWLFIRSFMDRGAMRALVADKYGRSVVYEGWQAALAIYMALLITAVIMLGELFFFHVVLISKGLTTYDYIIAQRDAKLAAPPTRSASANMKACRSSRVADASTAKRKVRVGINPCAAMRTSKPLKGASSYDAAAKGSTAGAAGGGASASCAPGGDSAASTTASAPIGKPPLDGAGSGSLGNSSVDAREGLGISDKATAAGSVQELVARAVAEQTVFNQSPGSSLREAALLRGGSAAGAGGAGCVPECGNGGASAGGAGGPLSASPSGRATSAGQDFTSLANARRQSSGAAPPPEPLRSQGRGSYGATGPGPDGFDAAGQTTGKHLGGHPASPQGGPTVAPQTALPPVPMSRPNSLPPLVSAPSLPSPLSPGAPTASRGLLLPSKSKSPRGAASAARRELPATPE